MFRNRKRIMKAAVLFMTFVMLLAFQNIQPAAATTLIREIRLTCNPASVGFDPANKEKYVSDKIMRQVACQTGGVEINTGNVGLHYWNEEYQRIDGIGSGEKQVNSSSRYFLYVMLEKNASYDWSDDVKALTVTMLGDYPISSCSLSVYLNGVKRTDARIRYNDYWDCIMLDLPFGPEMASCKATLSPKSFTYDGKAHKPDIKSLSLYGKNVPKGYWSLSFTDAGNKTVTAPVDAGKYYAVFKGTGMYRGIYKAAFTIDPADNTMTVKGKKLTVKAAKLAKKKQTINADKAFKISKAIGKVTFKKASGDKKITVSSSGKITIKKGLKPGKYKLTVKVTAAGDNNYRKLAKKVTVTITVK